MSHWQGGRNSSQSQSGEYYPTEGYTFTRRLTDYNSLNSEQFDWKHRSFHGERLGPTHVEALLHVSGGDFSRNKTCSLSVRIENNSDCRVVVFGGAACGTVQGAKGVADAALVKTDYVRCVLSRLYSEVSPDLTHLIDLDGVPFATMFRSYWDNGLVSYTVHEYFKLQRRRHGDRVSLLRHERCLTEISGPPVRERFERATGTVTRKPLDLW